MTAGPPGKPDKEEIRMTMAEIKPKKVLDQEWVILMRAARELGLQKEEVRSFLRQDKKPTSMNVHKR
jgi:Anti-repressor SinI